jgi:hypothetical protein
VSVAVVIPSWNSAAWLPGCLDSVAGQELQPAETIVVDNGSTDGSPELLRERYGWVRLVALPENTGFAHAANTGIGAASADYVALVNADVELAPDWTRRLAGALDSNARAAAVASKMVDLADPTQIYDAGDFLRRDGVCEQRGRFERDDGSLDEPGEAFAACAGAGMYRREAVLATGGFDERYFAYIEDVELGLRLRRAGWTALYEPALARHAAESSAHQLARPVPAWVERNTLLLVARHFPLRWAHLVLYRQAGWAWHALRGGGLGAHLRGAVAALRLLPAMLRERRADRRRAWQPTAAVVEARPVRRRANSIPSR